MNDDGDLCVAVGPNPTAEYRVFSGMLKTKPRVFRLMFGGELARGTEAKCEGVKWRTELPDDDPAPVDLIFAALHARND